MLSKSATISTIILILHYIMTLCIKSSDNSVIYHLYILFILYTTLQVTEAAEGHTEDPQMSCDYEYVMGTCYANSVPEELSKAEMHLSDAMKHCPNASERLADIYLELGNVKR